MKIIDGGTPKVKTITRWIEEKTPLIVKMKDGDVFRGIMIAASGDYFDCNDMEGSAGPSPLRDDVDEIREAKA